jgi:hypothetical protein
MPLFSHVTVYLSNLCRIKAMFEPHQNLSDQINGNIIRSEIEGGVYLKDLPDESTLEVATQNRRYTLVIRRDGQALIWGHPEFCPEPVEVRISGSNWGGSMLKAAFLGRGMHLEYRHPKYRGPIVTSAIVDIRLRAAA